MESGTKPRGPVALTEEPFWTLSLYSVFKGALQGHDGFESATTVGRPLSRPNKEIEAPQQTGHTKSQMASTAIQNFDQKANPMHYLRSSITKAMNEMRMGTARSVHLSPPGKSSGLPTPFR